MKLDFWNLKAGFDMSKPQRRWTVAKKYWLLRAVDDGALAAAEARRIHDISDDEWREWVSMAEFGALVGEDKAFRVRNAE